MLQDIVLAARFADRVIVLAGGAVLADGPPEAAITPDAFGRTYGVKTRVERCSQGSLAVVVDGRLDDAK